MDTEPSPSPELEAIVRRWLHAIFNQKAKTAVNLFSDLDSLSYIGTDLKEYWAGEIRQMQRARFGHRSRTRLIVQWQENKRSLIILARKEAIGNFGSGQ